MQSPFWVLDRAVKACGGSYAEVARRTGVSPQAIDRIRAGKMKISPEMAAELAAVAGLDPYEVAAAAMIENAKTPEKAERLRRVFLSRGASGVAGMLAICVSLGLLTPSDATAHGCGMAPSDSTSSTFWITRRRGQRRNLNIRSMTKAAISRTKAIARMISHMGAGLRVWRGVRSLRGPRLMRLIPSPGSSGVEACW